MAIEQGIFGQLREGFRRHLAPRRHSALLVSIIVTLAVRPLIGDRGGAASVMFSAAMLGLLLVALYNINVDEMVGERGRLLTQSRRRRRLGWVLATAAGLERVLILFHTQSNVIKLGGSISWLLFFLFVTLSELRSVLRQREVTSETISMAVSVYLLLGFSWGLVYAVIFQLHPDSFAGLTGVTSGGSVEVLHLFPVMGYFSLATLSTIGYGDITPLTLQARYAAVAEGITGQFYMAILVARLVGLQMSGPAAQPLESNNRSVAG
jgi:voltage-gated potassium channel